jgi:hypothetical protein
VARGQKKAGDLQSPGQSGGFETLPR